MPYLIQFRDAENVLEKKKTLRAVHLDYVTANMSRIVISGGLFPDDDDFPTGGYIVLDTERRQDAIDYIENDPFFLEKIFTEYRIDRCSKFIFDGRRPT